MICIIEYLLIAMKTLKRIPNMMNVGKNVSLMRLFLFRTVSFQFVIYAGHKFYHTNYSGEANLGYS